MPTTALKSINSSLTVIEGVELGPDVDIVKDMEGRALGIGRIRQWFTLHRKL
jgi:hypothetical protein